MGRISMFCGVENYVLRYKPVYYKVITDYVERIQYSVFSFFRCCYHSLILVIIIHYIKLLFRGGLNLKKCMAPKKG